MCRSVGFTPSVYGGTGREREMAALEDLLGRTRLLTMTGVGGAGKTRLAVEEIEAHLAARFGS